MPGLCGVVSADANSPAPDLESMLHALRYGRATVTECYQENLVSLGCAHLGTGGQQALYESPQAIVVFFGYLTRPSIPPGADAADPAAAAHHIHDLYLAQGEAMLGQIAGAFAFALWDRRTQTLLLVNDHLGLRPIYYAQHNGVFRFASEVKGLLADPTFPRRLDRAAVADFIYYSFVMGDKTFFQDVQLLPPASRLCYQDGHWAVSRYWDIVYPERYPKHPDRWYDDLVYNTLLTAVKRMLRPDLRYGLSLSGGLDSRWIAALLAQVQPKSLAFTIGIPASDDIALARQVTARTGLTHYCWEPSPTFVAELGEIFTYIADGMYSLFETQEFPLTVRVGNYVDVSVGGFLGDILFGYDVNPLSARLRKRDMTRYRLWMMQGEIPPPSLMARVFGKRTGQELTLLAMDSLESTLAAAPSDHGFQIAHYHNLRHRQRRFINAGQVAKLPYVDIYHPLADDEAMQVALQLPPRQLMIQTAYRRALGKYFPDLAAIPWAFTLTPATASVPVIVLKKAIQLTLGRWLYGTTLGNHPLIRYGRYYVSYPPWTRGPLRPFIEETLFSAEAEATGLFDPNGLRAVVRDHMEERLEATTFLGQVLALTLWARLFYVPSTPIRPSGLDKSNGK